MEISCNPVPGLLGFLMPQPRFPDPGGASSQPAYVVLRATQTVFPDRSMSPGLDLTLGAVASLALSEKLDPPLGGSMVSWEKAGSFRGPGSGCGPCPFMSLVTLAQPLLLPSLGVSLHKAGLGLFRARQMSLLAMETGCERPGPCATRDNFRQTGDRGSQAFSNIQKVTGEKSNSLKIGHMSKRTFYYFPLGLSWQALAGRSRDRPWRGHLAIKSSLGALGPKPLAPSLCPLLGQPGRTEAVSVSPQDCLGLALGSGQRGSS